MRPLADLHPSGLCVRDSSWPAGEKASDLETIHANLGSHADELPTRYFFRVGHRHDVVPTISAAYLMQGVCDFLLLDETTLHQEKCKHTSCMSESGSRAPCMLKKVLAAVQGRYKEDIVAALQLIFLFSLQLPVGIVDEY